MSIELNWWFIIVLIDEDVCYDNKKNDRDLKIIWL